MISSRMLSDTIERVLSAASKHSSGKPSFVVIKESNPKLNEDESIDQRNTSKFANKNEALCSGGSKGEKLLPSESLQKASKHDSKNGKNSRHSKLAAEELESRRNSKDVNIKFNAKIDPKSEDSDRRVIFEEFQNKHKSISKGKPHEKSKDSSMESSDNQTASIQVVSAPLKKPLYSARKMTQQQPKSLPKRVSIQYAITRINTFDDTSVTYEVMRPMNSNPMPFLGGDGLALTHSDVLFAVLPDRTTVCYSAV